MEVAVAAVVAVGFHPSPAVRPIPDPIPSYDGPLPPFPFVTRSFHQTRTSHFQSSGPTSGVGSSHPYTPSAPEYEGLFRRTQVSCLQTSYMPHQDKTEGTGSGQQPHRQAHGVCLYAAMLDLAKQLRSVCHRNSLSTLSEFYKIPSNSDSQSFWLARCKRAGLSKKWCIRFDPADSENTASTTKTISPFHLRSASKDVQVPEI